VYNFIPSFLKRIYNLKEFTFKFKNNKSYINLSLTYKFFDFKVIILLKEYSILTLAIAYKRLQNLVFKNDIEYSFKDVTALKNMLNKFKIISITGTKQRKNILEFLGVLVFE
jgi:hypothetical protein